MSLKSVPRALPLVLTGAVSAVTVSAAPQLPILETIATALGKDFGPLAAQATVAIGGAMVLPMLGLRGAYPMTWMVVGLAIPVAQWLKQNVLGGLFKSLGLSAYPGGRGYLPAGHSGIGAYPPNVPAFGAYPAVPRLNAFPIPGGFQPGAYNPFAGPYAGAAPGLRPVFMR